MRSTGLNGTGTTKRITSQTQAFTLSLLAVSLILTPVVICQATDTDQQPSCVVSATNVVDLSTCTNLGSGQQQCSVSYSLTTTLPSSGLSSCISMTDAAGNSLGMLTVTYDYVSTTALYGFSYATSDWTMAYQSDYWCPAVFEGFWCECATTGSDNPFNYFSDFNLDYPGATSCHTSSPGSSCFRSTACTFTRYSLHPTGPIGYVWGNPVISYVPHINITMTDATGTTLLQSGYVFPGTGFYGQFFSVTLAGVFSPTFRPTPPPMIMTTIPCDGCDLGVWGGTMATAGIPAANTIGDIQMPYQYAPINSVAGQNTFIYASGDISINTALRDTVLAQKSGYSQVIGAGSSGLNGIIPIYGSGASTQQFTGAYWEPTTITADTATLVNNGFSNGGVVISLMASQAISFTVSSSLVCPQISGTPTFAGCYNCNQGGTLTIPKACSTCAAGMAYVTSSSSSLLIFNNGVYLSTDCNSDTSLVIGVGSGQANQDVTLTFTAGGQVATISASGTFSAPVVVFSNWTSIEGTNLAVPPVDFGFTLGGTPGIPDWLSAFGSVFGLGDSLVGSIFSFILSIIFFAAVAFIAFTIGPTIFSCLWAKVSSMNKQKDKSSV